MKTTKKDAENVIDVLIDQITQKQSNLNEAKNYGKENQYGHAEISKAVRGIASAAKALLNYAEMIADADFSETPIG